MMMTLADEMMNWEVHALRNLVTALILFTQQHARRHPEAQPLADRFVLLKNQLRERQLAALTDPERRHER
jgi:hypothetical protein